MILLLSAVLLLVACGNEPAEADVYVPFGSRVAAFEQSEPPSLPQENEPPELKAYERCDCGLLSIHYLQALRAALSSPPLNIRDVDPFGFNTHFMYQFETVHTATYLQWETDWPSKIAIWSDEPLYDFTFVAVHHNAICCAYVGETLLTIDKLYPSDVVLLTVAFSHYLFPRGGIIFTDASGARHHMFIRESMIGGCAPGFFLSPTSSLLDHRENWLDLGIISIPSVFTYEEDELYNSISIITGCLFVPSEDVWGATHMWAGYLKVESLESMVERSLTARDFLFDDEHVGYMLEFDEEIWWVRKDGMAVSFRHGEYKFFFILHEDLILTIARTLTAL